MIRVLFVCLGNICRSPMAEAVFRHQVRQANLEEQIIAESAGTGDWHVGEPPHAKTQQILAQHEIRPTGRKARSMRPTDFDSYDYILTMDDANFSAVSTMQVALGRGKATIRPLLHYAPNLGCSEVPDPYYDDGFENVYRLIDAACENLLQAIRAEHGV